jgi:hypothetical protein
MARYQSGNEFARSASCAAAAVPESATTSTGFGVTPVQFANADDTTVLCQTEQREWSISLAFSKLWTPTGVANMRHRIERAGKWP